MARDARVNLPGSLAVHDHDVLAIAASSFQSPMTRGWWSCKIKVFCSFEASGLGRLPSYHVAVAMAMTFHLLTGRQLSGKRQTLLLHLSSRLFVLLCGWLLLLLLQFGFVVGYVVGYVVVAVAVVVATAAVVVVLVVVVVVVVLVAVAVVVAIMVVVVVVFAVAVLLFCKNVSGSH